MLPQILLLAMTAAACTPVATKEAVKNATRPAHAKVGLSARVVEGGAGFAVHGGRHFPMQSVYKLPIAITVLHRVEEDKMRLDQMVSVTEEDLIPSAGHSPLRDRHPKGGEFALEDLLRAAIADSDGSASDVLIRLLGGTREVRRFLKSAGIKDIHVQHTEAQLIENTQAQYADSATPDAMVDLLARLQQRKLLNPANTARLLGWLQETQTGKDRIRAKLPDGTVVADKTGSSGTYEGLTPATNDVALVTLPDGRHLAMAIFLRDARANTGSRNAAIADAARVIWDCWAGDTQ